jgi:hypothetical protein
MKIDLLGDLHLQVDRIKIKIEINMPFSERTGLGFAF